MSIKSKGKEESKGHEEKEREMRKGVEFLAASGLVWRLQRMTQQSIVSAHALLRVCWLFAGMSLCKSHARRGFMHRVPLPSPARGQRRPEPGRARTHTQGWASSLVWQSCSDIAVEGGKRKRDNGQTAGSARLESGLDTKTYTANKQG